VKLSDLHAFHAQRGEADERTDSLIRHQIIPNVVSVMWTDGISKAAGRVHGLFHHGRSCYTVSHMILNRPEGFTYIGLETTKAVWHVPMEKISFKKVGTDLVDVTFDEKTLPEFRDIRRHFAGPEEVAVNLEQCALIRPGKSGFEAVVGKLQYRKSSISYDDNLGDETFTLSEHLFAQVPNKAGDCGLVYVVYNTRMEKKIVGMHVAGNLSTGIVHLFPSAEYLAQADSTPYQPLVEVPKEIEFIGTVAPDQTPRLPLKSSIRRSQLYDAIAKNHEITRFPAKLRPFWKEGVRVEPAQLAINKNAVEDFVPSKEQKEIMEEIIPAVAKRLPYGSPVRLLSWDEVLNRPEGWKRVEKVMMDKSAGYVPEFLHGKVKGKWIVGYCPDCSKEGTYEKCTHPELGHQLKLKPEALEKLERIESQFKKRDYSALVEMMHMCCLKDELTTKEKSENGNTRLFSACSIYLLLLARRYLLSFVENVTSDPIQSFCALGINPHSQDWKMLFARLKRFGSATKWLPGDFKKFDASQKRLLAHTSCRIIKQWFKWHSDFDEDFYNVLDGIFECTYEGLYILLNVIYRAPGSNPSGQLLTTIHNCIVNLVAHIYCVMSERRSMGDKQYTPDDYFRDFEFTAFGDDHIETTAVDWYDMLKKKRWMSTLNMT